MGKLNIDEAPCCCLGLFAEEIFESFSKTFDENRYQLVNRWKLLAQIILPVDRCSFLCYLALSSGVSANRIVAKIFCADRCADIDTLSS